MLYVLLNIMLSYPQQNVDERSFSIPRHCPQSDLLSTAGWASFQPRGTDVTRVIFFPSLSNVWSCDYRPRYLCIAGTVEVRCQACQVIYCHLWASCLFDMSPKYGKGRGPILSTMGNRPMSRPAACLGKSDNTNAIMGNVHMWRTVTNT